MCSVNRHALLYDLSQLEKGHWKVSGAPCSESSSELDIPDIILTFTSWKKVLKFWITQYILQSNFKFIYTQV